MNAHSFIGMTLLTHMYKLHHISLATRENRPCMLQNGTKVIVSGLTERFQNEHHLSSSVVEAVFEIHEEQPELRRLCLRVGQHIIPLSEFDTGVEIRIIGIPLHRGEIAATLKQPLQQS